MRIALQRVTLVLLLWLCPPSVLNVLSQSVATELNSNLAPESGFLSLEKYTNAFFGFSLPLPRNLVLNEQTLSLARGERDHLLLEFHSRNNEFVSLTITAKEAGAKAEKVAKETAGMANLSKRKEIELAGKRFWTATSSGGVHGIQTLVFATAIGSYVIQFMIVSADSDATAEITRNIEHLSFFDPARSRLIAGADSTPYSPGAAVFPASPIGRLSAGSVSENIYQNEELKFRYEFPHDWVLMSKAPGKQFLQRVDQFPFGNSPAVQAEHEKADQCTKELLFVRHFLENPANGQFNPMLFLMAADPRCISKSDFPKSIGDHDSVQRIARDTLAYFRTADSKPIGPAIVRTFDNVNHIMIDVSQAFALNLPGGTAPIDVFSSILITQSEHYWVIWIFAAGNKSELDELKTTKVFFDDVVSPKTDSKM